MGLAIVAIPEENDRVWKVSSEKVPHLTLLFLGEAENADLQQIMQFVEHAVTLSEHGPFYLDVDRRGTLGEAEADVVFFNKRSWNLKWIKQFRGQLLQNQAIRTAYDSAEQFGAPQEWMPHVTLGYPQTPAKPLDNDDHPLYSVCFDRIAVWEGSYEGPDFRLEWPDRELEGDLAIAYSDTQKAALAHYGTKGMQWGKRRENYHRKQAADYRKAADQTENAKGFVNKALAGGPKPVRNAFAKDFRRTADRHEKKADKIVAKRDKKWEKDVFTSKTWVEVHNAGADHVNSKIAEINSSFERKHPKEMNDGTLLNESHPVTREYTKAYNKELVTGLNQGAAKLPQSPSGKYKVKVVSKNHDKISEFSWGLDREEIKHTIEDLELIFVADRDSNGRITKVTPQVEEENAMAQTADLGEEFLEHYGKKGMKWGVRTDRHGRDRFDPKDHSVGGDVAKALLIPIPGGGVPSMVRLGKRANRGTKAYLEKRKSPEAVAKRAARKLARRDTYWEMHAYSDISHSDVHNKVADEIDSKVYNLQSAPKYRGKNLNADKKLKDEYDQDIAKVTDSAYRRSVKDTYGVNPSGTKKAEYVNDARGHRIEIRDLKSGKTLSERSLEPKVEDDIETEDSVGHSALSHAEAAKFEDPDIMMTVKVDDQGFITQIGRVKLPEDEEDTIAQSAMMGEAFAEGLIHGAPELGEAFILEHYGVRGMRWGFRREKPTAVAPTASSKVPHGTKRKTKIETDGGENHPAHEDAIKVAQARTKLKKSGPAALSNQELRDVANRIQLENQVTLLSSSKGKQFVKRKLQSEGQELAWRGAKKGGKKVAKKAAVAALL